jgi:hypothetical protein
MAMSPKNLSKIVCLITIFSALAASTLAQYRAGIQGAVLDAQGDTINAATVTLTNKETNRKRARGFSGHQETI